MKAKSLMDCKTFDEVCDLNRDNFSYGDFTIQSDGITVWLWRQKVGEAPTPDPSPRAADLEAPVPMLLHCPTCRERHIDAGKFATKPHHTHACQSCGMVWRPAIGPTVGVQFLPGFKDSVFASDRGEKDPCAANPPEETPAPGTELESMVARGEIIGYEIDRMPGKASVRLEWMKYAENCPEGWSSTGRGYGPDVPAALEAAKKKMPRKDPQ